MAECLLFVSAPELVWRPTFQNGGTARLLMMQINYFFINDMWIDVNAIFAP